LIVSVCRWTEKSDASVTRRLPSITAGEAPKSSWIFTPSAPRATVSATASGLELPRPRKPKLSGHSSAARMMRPSVWGREQLTSKLGPGDMPIIVAEPPASPWYACCGDRKWAWASTVHAVTK